jgi:hypothetical protein
MHQIVSKHRPDGYQLCVAERKITGFLGKRINLHMLESWEEGINSLNPLPRSVLDELDSSKGLLPLDRASERDLPFRCALFPAF